VQGETQNHQSEEVKQALEYNNHDAAGPSVTGFLRTRTVNFSSTYLEGIRNYTVLNIRLKV
jgi:hypothetical protein